MRTLKPYPAYKESGVPWLGDVPSHWEMRRLKTLCSMKSGESITTMSIDPTGQYPVYGGNGLRGYTARYTHDGPHVLMGRQGALCGNIHIAHGRFWASEHAVVSTLYRDHVLEWFSEILTVMNLNQYSIAAAQPGLAVERILELWLPVPPLTEQTVIVRFLDHADRRIRRYIRAKEKLIALLEEQRAGHHPPGRHGPDRRPHWPALPGLQVLRRRVAGQCAGALERQEIAPVWNDGRRDDPEHGGASVLGW